jgi:hypothetical protein
MSIWPWRSRPVVTPFQDNYSGRILTFDDFPSADTLTVTIPDNLYLIPTSIAFDAVCVAGIRNTTDSALYFSRGGTSFAAVHFSRFTSLHTYQYYFAPYGAALNANVPDFLRSSFLPYPIFLYPNDLITLYLASFLAGDTYGPLTIHGKFWEVH